MYVISSGSSQAGALRPRKGTCGGQVMRLKQLFQKPLFFLFNQKHAVKENQSHGQNFTISDSITSSSPRALSDIDGCAMKRHTPSKKKTDND